MHCGFKIGIASDSRFDVIQGTHVPLIAKLLWRLFLGRKVNREDIENLLHQILILLLAFGEVVAIEAGGGSFEPMTEHGPGEMHGQCV